MSSERASFAALDDLLAHVRCLFLAFDGPVCSLFAGMSMASVADRLRKALAKEDVRLPQAIEATNDWSDILAFAASVSPHLATRAETELTELELAAVVTAEPTAYIYDVVAACHESARSTAIISSNSAARVHAYFEQHDLSSRIDAVAARTGYDPAILEPRRHVIDQAASALGAVPSACAVVGGFASDIQAARAAGARSIGYAKATADAEHLASAGADAVLFSMADLALRLRAHPANLDLLQLSLRLQGRTFGAPGLTVQAVNSEGGPEQLKGMSGQGDPP